MKKTYLVLVLLLVISLIFRNWFNMSLIASGDFGFFFKSQYSFFSIYPYAWNFSQGNGLGGNLSPFLWIYLNGSIPVKLFGQVLSLPWFLTERIAYLFPFLILSFLSSYILFAKLFRNSITGLLSGVLFTTNTYVLMIIGGAQVEIAISYALSPLTLLLFLSVLQKLKHGNIRTALGIIITSGFVLGLQVLIDPRLVYVVLIAVCLYILLDSISKRAINTSFTSLIINIIRMYIVVLGIPGVIALLLHAFWLLPTVLVHSNPLKQLGSAYTTTNAVQYFSFAKFEDAMGLLHPNWPENIFGLTHFMRPEFLLLPILAFASLLFVKKTKDIKEQEQKGYILFFALLGLIGIFLAKGANDPFGGVYLWLFAHIPGFVMFRDPTKWYLLIALSYSMLIPFTVSQMYEVIKNKAEFLSVRLLQGKIFNFQNLLVILVVGYLLFLIRPALLGQLGGTFRPHKLPPDYVTFEKYMVGEKNFSRVLWIPSLERFGFYSPTHPAVGSESLYNVTSVEGVMHLLSQKQTQTFLQQRGIGYIVVPYDVEGELFVKDRKYDNAEYLKTIEFLRKLPWLREIPGFGRIHVFQVSKAKDLFWVTNRSSTKIAYTPINPTKYLLHVANAQKGDKIVFASTYDSHWQLTIGRSRITPVAFEQSLNMFVLPQDGTFTATLYYTPQTWVDIGLVISLVTVVIVVGYFSYSFYSARQKQ